MQARTWQQKGIEAGLELGAWFMVLAVAQGHVVQFHDTFACGLIFVSWQLHRIGIKRHIYTQVGVPGRRLVQE